MNFERYLDYPFRLTRFETSFELKFRRTLQQIRDDQVGGARVIWFLHEGSLEVVRSRKSYTVSAGEWCVLSADEPKTIRVIPRPRGRFSANHAILPAHLFHSHMSGATELTESFPIQFGGQVVISKFLQLLIEVGDKLSRTAAEYLAHALLTEIAATLTGPLSELTQHQKTMDKRYDQIEESIVKNLTNATLNHKQVARECGISARYLCYVLKAHNTSFSEILWTQRLFRTRDWLHADGYKNQPIGQLALMAGFKSGSHFSKMFKRHFGMSPKDYRETATKNLSKVTHVSTVSTASTKRS